MAIAGYRIFVFRRCLAVARAAHFYSLWRGFVCVSYFKWLTSFFFADFWRILVSIAPANRIKTYFLFVLMIFQSILEMCFILTLTFLGAALTSPEGLNGNYLFRALYCLSPQLRDWGQNPLYLLLMTGCIVVFVSVLKNWICYVTARATIQLSERVALDVGREIMHCFLFSSYTWHLSSESSATFQCMQWRGQLATILISQLSMLSYILTMVILFFSLVGQEPILTSIIVSFLVFSGIFVYKGMRFSVDSAAQIVAASAREEARAVLCATRGIRDVLIYRQQEIFEQSVIRAAECGISARAFTTIAPNIPTWVLEVISFSVVVIALFYLVFFEHADIPRITMALGLLMLTAWRIMPYANRVVSLQVAIRGVRPMALAVLDMMETLRKEPRAMLPQPSEGFTFHRNISLRDVSFKYPSASECSLRGVSFDIPVGKKVGIIGPSGGGKSTLVGVLSGLLAPQQGKILVDGQVLTPSRSAAFSRIIGYVPQSPFLFEGTLAENIAFSEWGKPWNKERVLDACKRAAIDFVDSHPMGLELPIGENGAGLSGGQAQRVSIARAMYANPRLLIFDEATSALDQANEKSIQETIDHLAVEVTCVLVAHRLTTVENCDVLIWLDKGQIVMQGPPTQVLVEYNKSLKSFSS